MEPFVQTTLAYELVVGPHRVVTNLTWQNLDKRRASAQLVEQAAAINASYAILLEDNGAAIGGIIPPGSPRAVQKLYSAAAWIARAYPEIISTIICHEVAPNVYWILAVDKGMVAVETDVILPGSGATTLLSNLLIARQGPNLAFIQSGDNLPYLPAVSRNEVNVEIAVLADLFSQRPPDKSAKPKQIRGLTLQMLAGVAALGIGAAALAGGWVWYEHVEEQKALAAEQARILREQQENERIRTLTDVRINDAVRNAIRDDTATPTPSEMIEACYARVNATDMQLGGWAMQDAECDLISGQITVRYMHRESGTSETFAVAARRAGYEPSVAITGKAAQVVSSFAAPAPRTALQLAQLPRAVDVGQRLVSRLQLAEQSGTVTATVTEPTQRGVMYADPNMADSEPSRFKPVPADRGYQTGTITLASDQLWVLPAISLDYPIVTAKKIVFRPEGGTYRWTLEASYAVV